MPRYRLEIEFDGSGFVGWQRQLNGPSIQSTLEDAVFAMLGERITAIAAGRTDAGVHALAMTAHIDLTRNLAPARLQSGLNHFLKPDHIAVLLVRVAPPDFHARFSATARRYRYQILNRAAPPALANNQVWHVAQALDAEAMHQAAQCLQGKHDFTSFRASECQAKSPIKTLTHIEVSRHEDQIDIVLQAPSFLHHQVRNIAGTLKLVGAGARDTGFVKQALEACQRSAAGPTAPAHGLYFVEALYPDPIDETD